MTSELRNDYSFFSRGCKGDLVIKDNIVLTFIEDDQEDGDYIALLEIGGRGWRFLCERRIYVSRYSPREIYNYYKLTTRSILKLGYYDE